MKHTLNAIFVGLLAALPLVALYFAITYPWILLVLAGFMGIGLGILTYREFITFDTVILTGNNEEKNG